MAGLPDSCQQHAGGFVVAVLLLGEGVFGGDEFASEGFGQERLREAVDVRLRLPQPGLDLVRERKQLFDSTHDFLLLGQRGTFFLRDALNDCKPGDVVGRSEVVLCPVGFDEAAGEEPFAFARGTLFSGGHGTDADSVFDVEDGEFRCVGFIGEREVFSK